MQIHLIAVGDKMPRWVSDGYAEYARRLPAECALRLVEISAGKRGRKADITRILRDEGERLLAFDLSGRGVVLSEEEPIEVTMTPSYMLSTREIDPRPSLSALEATLLAHGSMRGRKALVLGRTDLSGKTGTSNDAKDLNAYGYIAPPSNQGRRNGEFALSVAALNDGARAWPQPLSLQLYRIPEIAVRQASRTGDQAG